jgi:ELWxxDGT repeat protein
MELLEDRCLLAVVSDGNWGQMFNPTIPFSVSGTVARDFTIPPGPNAAVAVAANYIGTPVLSLTIDLDLNGTIDFTLDQSNATPGGDLLDLDRPGDKFVQGNHVSKFAPIGMSGETLNSTIWTVPIGTNATARDVRVALSGGATTIFLATVGSYHGVQQTDPVGSVAADSAATVVGFSLLPLGPVNEDDLTLSSLFALARPGLSLTDLVPDPLGADASTIDQTEVLDWGISLASGNSFRGGVSMDDADDTDADTSPNTVNTDWSFSPSGAAAFTHVGVELQSKSSPLLEFEILKDIRPGSIGSFPRSFTRIGSTLYFVADDGTTGYELWKSDGTSAGTVRVKDISPGSVGSYPSELTNVGGTLYFRANDGTAGSELWRSDGTSAGTVRVKDIRAGITGSFPTSLTNVGGTLYFTAEDGSTSGEVWKSDGTSAGTVLVKEIRPGNTGSYPSGLTNISGTLYFAASDGTTGSELWKSNGTSAGTVRVKDIVPGSSSSFPSELTNVGGTLYFRASEGATGSELWKSDGTTAGTVLVKDILAGSSSSSPFWLANIGGTLYFAASDSATGNELWKSNGTSAGTVRVADIFAGSSGSFPSELTDVGGMLYFTANDGTGFRNLWKSDGTPSGTVRVKDSFPGSANAFLNGLTNISGTLYFGVGSSGDGSGAGSPTFYKLWRSDGTSNGTVMVSDLDLYGGPDIIEIGGKMFVVGDTSQFGEEIYVARTIHPDELEDNDDSANATNLGGGDQNYSGLTIDAPGDDDWYRWLAPRSGPLTVDVLFTHAENNDVDLFLYDAQDELIAFSNGVSNNEQVMTSVTGGQSYLILVHGYAGSVHRDYDLAINGPDPFAADFNLDGRVDGNDMLILQTGVGINSGATRADGDADGNGRVDIDDFEIWQGQYGSPFAAAGAATPGPTASDTGISADSRKPPNASAPAAAELQLDGVPPPTSSTPTTDRDAVAAETVDTDRGSPAGRLPPTDNSTRPRFAREAAVFTPIRRSNFPNGDGQHQPSVAARLAALAVDGRDSVSAQQASRRDPHAPALGWLICEDVRALRAEDEPYSSAAEMTDQANAIDRYFEQFENGRSLPERIWRWTR